MLNACSSTPTQGAALMDRKITLSLVAALYVLAGGAVAQPVVAYVKDGAKFEDVRDDLKTAIESKGFVIDYQAQIASMLERTGKDLGSTEKIYAGAQSLQFCSAQLSRKMMQADAANVVMCPYTLVVYATAANPQRVVVAYRRPMNGAASPASQAALKEVDALLDGLAREAIGRK
jgi:uncharacterized protein (DUF302 family)